MALDSSRLWAKSQWGEEVDQELLLLPRHLQDVHAAAVRVLEATADDQLGALGLDPAAYRDQLRRCVLLAAAVHDLGKANDHFQGMLLKSRDRLDKPQGLRHEWVTVLLLREQPLRNWLVSVAGEADAAIVEWAVGGHHPAYNRESPPRRADPRGAGDRMTVHAEYRDFAECLAWLGKEFGDTLPIFDKPIVYPLIGPGRADERFGTWFREASRAWDDMTAPEKRFTAAVKACVLAADVAGSALPRAVADPGKWIDETFTNRPREEELAGLVERRLAGERERRKDSTIKLLPFQEAVGASVAPVTFVRAGCGSGKTMAAYHWAATKHPARRLYFCYPTTGTATEGFKDYLHNPDAEHNYRLFHGRADVDLAGLLPVKGDEPNAEADAAARLEALDAWGTPVVSCTVDTVLGLVQNSRRGLFAWPALAGAAFVFDEIHAYDDRLFGALLRFLQAVPGVPVLMMTASLPQARRTALDDCLKRAKRPPVNEIGGPEDLETRPRYVWDQQYATTETAIAQVRAELAKPDGKVLWVCNTVNRAMVAAAALPGSLVYHSRFRYCDRVEQHKQVVAAFKPEHAGGVVACTTQVAEMSLDLKGTTLLVTELAPVPALIQRLGRLARDAQGGDPPRPFIVIDVGDDHLPYTPDELKVARNWLSALGTGQLSQRKLAEVWQQNDAAGWKPHPDDLSSAWLDGGPETRVLELRKASLGITVVLEEDFAKLKRYAARIASIFRAGKEPTVQQRLPHSGEELLARVAIPMPQPRTSEWQLSDRNGAPQEFKGLPVARNDAIDYTREQGAKWRSEE